MAIRNIVKEGDPVFMVTDLLIHLSNDQLQKTADKVIEGEKGLFIAMPSKKSADGEYRDIAHPINSETRSMLEEIILKSYEESAIQEEGAQD